MRNLVPTLGPRARHRTGPFSRLQEKAGDEGAVRFGTHPHPNPLPLCGRGGNPFHASRVARSAVEQPT
jgi:hypothetical protein